jgi:hypothetical protein
MAVGAVVAAACPVVAVAGTGVAAGSVPQADSPNVSTIKSDNKLFLAFITFFPPE